MYPHLLATHSALRWLVLIGIVLAIVQGFSGWLGNKSYTKSNDAVRKYTVILVHIQLVVGLILYFVSPLVKQFTENFKASVKITELRYFGMEHTIIMILAVILITIGSAKAKRKTTDQAKFKTIAIWFTIALILILAMVPWSFSHVARPNFRGF